MWRSESLRRREELVAARAAHGSEREQIEGDLERVRTASPLPPAFGAHRDRNAEFAAFGAAAQAFVRVAPLLAEIDASEDLPPEPSPEALALADAWDATTPEIQQSQTQTGDADSVVASAELRVEEARLALAMAPGGLGDSVRADLDRLHRAVVDAEARVFGARRGQRNYAVRRYNRARAAERAALAAAGVDSYAALHLGTTMSESPGDDLAREAAQEQLAAAIEALDAARRSRHLAGGEQLTQRVEQMRAHARELLGREPGDDLSGELRALRIDVSARGDRIRQLADVLRRAGVAVGDDVVGQARQFAKTPPSIRVTESLTWPKPGAQFEMPMSEIEQLERRSRDQQQLIVAIDAELTRIDAIGDAGLIDLAADDFAHVFVLILGAYRSGYVLEGRLPIVLDGVLDDVAADARERGGGDPRRGRRCAGDRRHRRSRGHEVRRRRGASDRAGRSPTRLRSPSPSRRRRPSRPRHGHRRELPRANPRSRPRRGPASPGRKRRDRLEQMEHPASTRSRTPGRGRVRLFLIFALLAVAIVWPLVNVGPRGAATFMFSPQHGVDVGDLAAVFPFALAVVLALHPRGR